MKFFYIAIMAGTLAACAHVSEYNQGCRDGVMTAFRLSDTPDNPRFGLIGLGKDQKVTDDFCTMLDSQHTRKERANK